jgi:hypothetical protein
MKHIADIGGIIHIWPDGDLHILNPKTGMMELVGMIVDRELLILSPASNQAADVAARKMKKAFKSLKISK